MAITTNFQSVREKFNPRYWDSIDEFEEYYLQDFAERIPDTNYYTDKSGTERVIPPINHFPELREYEVWMEGYAATGESEGASLVGKVKARNFAQACHILMCKQQLERIERENQPSHKGYSTPGRWDYDPSSLTYWGCRLYWSEDLAKKSFG